MNNILIIGIAGGSGSGKTTFAHRLANSLGDDLCTVIAQDSYYIDQSHLFDHDGGSVNFDHPDALDFALMAGHLNDLRCGKTIHVPVYDFASHKRVDAQQLDPVQIIFVDGILIFSQPELLDHFDHKLYIDCPEDIRFQRRLHRDVNERGRTEQGVHDQFHKQVKPMHDQFVEPSKNHACDIVNIDNFDEKVSHWTNLINQKMLAF